MKRKSKKYLEVADKVEKGKLYSKAEAIKLAKETSITNFDASVELAVRLNLDSKKSDQQIRGALVLPNGIGKTQKVLVIAKGDKAKEAIEANADYVGEADMIEKIEKENWFDFDVIIATPDMMVALGKLGKVLGPKGLMPNPKIGTVTNDIKKAIMDVKKGKIEYRSDKAGNVHVVIGKVSFTEQQLLENFEAIMEAILNAKPSGVKGIYIKNIFLSTTMGPSIKLDFMQFDK
ncbi:MAG: 50S ribosomal protein L1 [Bacilli bacterium]